MGLYLDNSIIFSSSILVYELEHTSCGFMKLWKAGVGHSVLLLSLVLWLFSPFPFSGVSLFFSFLSSFFFSFSPFPLLTFFLCLNRQLNPKRKNFTFSTKKTHRSEFLVQLCPIPWKLPQVQEMIVHISYSIVVIDNGF